MLLRVRTRRAAHLPPELLATWQAAESSWFTGAGAGEPLPGAEDSPHLRRVRTPLGPIVAKRAANRARAPRAFDLATSLLAAGLSTPEPLAAWSPGSTGPSILITRYAEGLAPWTFLASEGGGSEPRITELARSLGLHIARLHAAGFRHRDLKAPNLLVARTESTTLEVTFLDLDGLSERAHLTDRTRIRDLARLRVSFDSREAHDAGMRPRHFPLVVKAYLEAASTSSPRTADLKTYLAETATWARRHLEHILARGTRVR